MEFKTRSRTTTQPKTTALKRESGFHRQNTQTTKPVDRPIGAAITGRIKLSPRLADSNQEQKALNPEKVKASKFHVPTTPKLKIGRQRTEEASATLDPSKVKDSKFHQGVGTAAPTQTRGATTPKPPQDKKPLTVKLSDTQIEEAKAWYAKKADQYTPAVMKEIQQKLGLPQTGKVDTTTPQGIAKWQGKTKHLPLLGNEAVIKQNGKLGPDSLGRLLPIGLATDKASSTLAEQADALHAKWAKLTDSQKINNLSNLINNALADSGIPKMKKFSSVDSKGSYNGVFDFREWSIRIDTNVINSVNNKSSFNSLIQTLTHEARHAEQFYKMAQFSPKNSDIFQDIPKDIAKTAQNNLLQKGTAASIQVSDWYNSVYGSGAKFRNDITTKTISTSNEMVSVLPGKIEAANKYLDSLYSLLASARSAKDKKLEKELVKNIAITEDKLNAYEDKKSKLEAIYPQLIEKYYTVPIEADAERTGQKIAGKMK